jgi:hypothetical protein
MPLLASSDPKALRPRSRGLAWAAALVTIVGVGGMLGLLFAARASPAHAGLLQAAALLWFLLWGVVRVFTPRP